MRRLSTGSRPPIKAFRRSRCGRGRVRASLSVQTRSMDRSARIRPSRDLANRRGQQSGGGRAGWAAGAGGGRGLSGAVARRAPGKGSGTRELVCRKAALRRDLPGNRSDAFGQRSGRSPAGSARRPALAADLRPASRQCAASQLGPWPTSTTSGTSRCAACSMTSRISPAVGSISASGTSNTSSSWTWSSMRAPRLELRSARARRGSSPAA